MLLLSHATLLQSLCSWFLDPILVSAKWADPLFQLIVIVFDPVSVIWHNHHPYHCLVICKFDEQNLIVVFWVIDRNMGFVRPRMWPKVGPWGWLKLTVSRCLDIETWKNWSTVSNSQKGRVWVKRSVYYWYWDVFLPWSLQLPVIQWQFPVCPFLDISNLGSICYS